MSRAFYGCPFLVLLALWVTTARAAEPDLKPVLIEGTWTHHGGRSIIGSGRDTTVELKKSGNNWVIAYETTDYPSVNDKDRTPKTKRQGPYPVTVEDQELVVTKEPGKLPVRYTFLCDERRLIMPAIVQKKPGEWSYRSESTWLTVRCESDPFKVPIGKAQVPGVLLGKAYYSYEEAPRSPLWPSAQYLRFLERSDEKGQLVERFRFIFDAHGLPRHERFLGTGERSGDDFPLRLYIRPEKVK